MQLGSNCAGISKSFGTPPSGKILMRLRSMKTGPFELNGTSAAIMSFVELIERRACEDWPVTWNSPRTNRSGFHARAIDDHDQFRAA